MKKFSLVLIMFLSLNTYSIADDKPSNDELDAAISECIQEVKQDNNGKPNMEEFEKCMSDKSFKKPKDEKRDGGRPPKPPREEH